MASMLPEKKKAPCTPSLWGQHKAKRYVIEDATEKEKKRDTRHNTKKNKNHKRRGRTAAPAPHPTNPPKACRRCLSTGGKMRGGTNREVCISHNA